MPAYVACDAGHGGGLCRDAAIEISGNGSLKPCHRCGAPRRYIVHFHFANSDETEEYELEKVARLYSNDEAEKEGYDPMIFLLRYRGESEDRIVWPFYWGKDSKRRWRVGQFPPLLSVEELKNLIHQLGIS